MTQYSSFGQLPIFHKLRATCEQLRGSIVLPMKKDLEYVRDQLKAERARLVASATPKQSATTGSDGSTTANGKAGPGSV